MTAIADREAFGEMWKRSFDETLEKGLARVQVLTSRFGTMDLFEREGPGGKAGFDSTRTVMGDKDFARVAVLSMLGTAALGEGLPQMTKLLGMREEPTEVVESKMACGGCGGLIDPVQGCRGCGTHLDQQEGPS